MFALRFCWILLIPAITAAAPADELRTWTDTSGRTVEARFVRVFSGKAILEAKDGRSLPVPLSRLSAADRQYIQEQTGPNKGAADGEVTPKPDSKGPITDQATSPKDVKPSTADAQKAKLAAAELRRVRDWNFAGGNFKGRFERFFGRRVIIMQANRPRPIEFSALSAADQDFLRRNFEALGKAAEIPTAVATTSPTAGDNDAAKNALATSLGQLAGALAASPSANAGTPATGPPAGRLSPPFPQGSPPDMGGFAEQMRRQQEQMRQQQEQRRAELEEIKRKTREAVAKLEDARRIPPSSRMPAPPAASSAASNHSPGVPPASTPQHGAHSPFAHSTPQPSTEPPQPQAETPLAGLSSLFGGAQSGQPSGPAPQSQPPHAGPPQYQQVEVIVCGKCNKEQKPGFKAGQRCQHCGVVIDTITDEGGKVVDRSARATGKSIKFWIWVVLTVVGVIGGLVAKVKSS